MSIHLSTWGGRLEVLETQICTHKDRMLQIGQRVRVYRNLHKKCFSIQDHQTGLVIGYAPLITLECVLFRVQASGRKRVLRENRKHVHAYAVGILRSFQQEVQQNKVTYQPYLRGEFYQVVNGVAVYKAGKASFSSDGYVYIEST